MYFKTLQVCPTLEGRTIGQHEKSTFSISHLVNEMGVSYYMYKLSLNVT